MARNDRASDACARGFVETESMQEIVDAVNMAATDGALTFAGGPRQLKVGAECKMNPPAVRG
jgi:hypothetical protein